MHSLLQPKQLNMAPCTEVKHNPSPHFQKNQENKPTTKNNPKHKQKSSTQATTHFHTKKKLQQKNQKITKRTQFAFPTGPKKAK